VTAEWLVPRTRSSYEWAYLRFAADHVPGSVPRPLAHDPNLSIIAMEFLEPSEFPVWKQQLMDRQVDDATARSVGAMLGQLHGLSAHSPELAQKFDTLENFRAIRLDPYLLATRSAIRTGPASCTAGRAHRGFENRAGTWDVSPRTFWSMPRVRYFWMPSVPGSAIRPSIWPSA